MDHRQAGPVDDGGGLIRRPAGLDDDPGDLVRKEHQGVGEAREVEGLEGADVGGRDDDQKLGTFHPELQPLLPLHPLDQLVRPHHLHRVRVRPRPDADPVPADHHPAGRPVQENGVVRGGPGEGDGEERGGGGGGDGDGGGGRVGEEEEEEESGESEAEDEADDATDGVEGEPEDGRRGAEDAVDGADAGVDDGGGGAEAVGPAGVAVLLQQGELHGS